MKCTWCHKKIKENFGVHMYASGELISSYCSSNCRTKAFQSMTTILESIGHKKLKKKKKGGVG